MRRSMPRCGRLIFTSRCRWTARPRATRGVANWFAIQFREEQDHAQIFANYVLARGGEVKLAPIAAVDTAWSRPGGIPSRRSNTSAR